MRQRFERTEGDRDRVVTAKPRVAAKRKVEDTVTVTAGGRKAPKLVAGKETVVTASPMEETDSSGQIKVSNYPHQLNCSETGAEGQRGEGQSYRGDVLGEGQGVQVGKRDLLAAAFKPSQHQPGWELCSGKSKLKAVIGSAAACGSASTNGGLASSQLRD